MSHNRTTFQYLRHLLPWLLVLFPTAFPCWGQAGKAAQTKPEDVVEWYVVLPGDNLYTITEKFLGDADLWTENHRLNPHIKDPNLLRIGERLRIITSRTMPMSQAEVEKVIRDVKRRAPNDPWHKARVGDILVEKNEVRTFRRASTRLRFDDGSHLNIKEESLIFLRKVGHNLRGVDRQSIEIIEGEADLAQRGKRKRHSDIEILVGGVLAKPEPDDSGLFATRTRKAEGGQAHVMVYDGKTAVDSAGTTVDVPKGMGTVVDQGQPPAPPRKLLSAPKLLSPGNGLGLAFANPQFSWQPVADAASYTFELCDDPQCLTPTFRQTRIAGTSYQGEVLSKGPHYWRVTAVSSENLDGFPSQAHLLEITADRPDTLAPSVVAYPSGNGRVEEPDSILLGPTGAIQLIAQDDAAGVAGIQFRWNEDEWQTYAGQWLTLPEGQDAAILQARATDNIGKVSQVLSIRVKLATSVPQPPKIEKPRQ